jgi:hypothetical protein
MNARTIVKTLKGHWHGHYGVCRCPVHSDHSPSLTVADGHTSIVVKCFAGCGNGDIINALRDMGMIDDAEPRDPYRPARRIEPKPVDIDPRKAEAVLRIWREAEPIKGTVAEIYLRARGIGIDIPVSLRFHPALKHGPSGQHLPALVAGFQGAGRDLNAVHRTFLRPDGSGKADVDQQKLALGCMHGGAVRLARAIETIGIAEGIETALSAMELFGIPTWAACGSRLADIQLPPEVKRVVIFADNGAPGIEAAEKAKQAQFEQNRRVAIRYPTIGKDWNDELQACKMVPHA